MNDMPSIDPAKRQVLINLGNRFVVFGPDAGLPEPLRFDPEQPSILPRDDQVVASFVPRGLWFIGAWGRIDVITLEKTWILRAIKKSDKLEWKLAPSDNRRWTVFFDKSALLELMNGQ